MSIKKLYKKLTRSSWAIGFVIDGLEGVFSENPQYVWVRDPNVEERWFADPFILDVNDNYIILLVEEMSYAVHKGRIAKLIINRQTMTIEKVDILLEEDTHLSFPNIWRDGEDIYVYPENYEGGGLNLYKLTDNATRLEKVGALSKEPLTDAVMTDIFEKTQIFSTKMPNPNGDELFIYTIDKSFEVATIQGVKFVDKHARMAGQFFKYNGKVYRPAQDCNKIYGGAVIIEEVEKKGGEFIFKPVKRLTSKHTSLRIGMHTLNEYKGVVVIDVKGYEYILGKIIDKCVMLKKKMKLIFSGNL